MWNGGTSGKYNGSLAFDGVGDYATVADNDNLSFGNGNANFPFSISAWVNMSSATNRIIIAKEDDTTGNTKMEYDLYSDGSNKLHFAIYDQSSGGYIGRTWNSAFPTGSWHHVTATYDGSANNSGIKLYSDGVRMDNADFSGGNFHYLYNTTAPLMIGYFISNDGNRHGYFNGLMDDVRIYNYALTPVQVQTLYNNNSAVKF
jgi:hypothetical protein